MDRLLAKNRNIWLLPSAILGGGPGVGLVLKKQNTRSAFRMATIASVFYASLWAMIHGLRPDSVAPVDMWPSFDFLNQLVDWVNPFS